MELDDEEGVAVVGAAEDGDLLTLKRLLTKNSALCNFADAKGKTPLLAGIKNEKVVSFLLERGADVNLAGKGNWTPLHAACSVKKNDLVIQMLLKAGAKADARNADGNTALHYFARTYDAGSEGVLDDLIRSGCDVDCRNRLDETALLLAAWRNNSALCSALLSRGADPSLVTSTRQWTPLHAAASAGAMRAVWALLEGWGGAELKDGEGRAACDVCGEGNKELKRELERARSTCTWLWQAGVERRWHPTFLRERFDEEALDASRDDVMQQMGLPAAVRMKILNYADKRNAAKEGVVVAAAAPSHGAAAAAVVVHSEKDLEEEEVRKILRDKGVPVVEPINVRVLHPIGSGFYSEVRLAEWAGVLVAHKSIVRSAGPMKTHVQLLLQEVTIMARLRHPNIVPLLGVVASSPLAILSTYMPGGTLYALVRSPRWPQEQSVRYLKICLDICRGMAYLHSQCGILHRDLTTKNVLLDSDGTARISDFGVSRLDNPDYLTHPVGALAYVAPEVIVQSRYSQAADVYSFAIMACEMLTGTDPGGTMKPKEMAEAVVNKGYRPALPPLVGSWYDQSLLSLIRRAWSLAPEDRPSFLELMSEIEGLHNDASDEGYVTERMDL